MPDEVEQVPIPEPSFAGARSVFRAMVLSAEISLLEMSILVLPEVLLLRLKAQIIYLMFQLVILQALVKLVEMEQMDIVQ